MIDTSYRSSAVFAGSSVLGFGSSSGIFILNQEEDEDELYEDAAYEEEDEDELAEEEEGTEGGKESKEVAEY